MNSISTTCTAEINVIDADVDVCTNATTLVRLMDSDLKSVYAVLFSSFLAKRGAERRAARFIISSRAKRACISQASHGRRDFLLAINLSSLVGVRLDLLTSRAFERVARL